MLIEDISRVQNCCIYVIWLLCSKKSISRIKQIMCLLEVQHFYSSIKVVRTNVTKSYSLGIIFNFTNELRLEWRIYSHLTLLARQASALVVILQYLSERMQLLFHSTCCSFTLDPMISPWGWQMDIPSDCGSTYGSVMYLPSLSKRSILLVPMTTYISFYCFSKAPFLQFYFYFSPRLSNLFPTFPFSMPLLPPHSSIVLCNHCCNSATLLICRYSASKLCFL